jgi:UDP-N-acetyl-alpha-D-muramoyl-L-alanyl-L-glutamate epimerase
MPVPDHGADRFHYDGFTVDTDSGTVACTYSTPSHSFTERYSFGSDRDWGRPGVAEALRILFLLAGVSYYKTTAAPVIELGDTATTPAERAFLTGYYVDGLGEFAHRNHLDLSGLRVDGPLQPASAKASAGTAHRDLDPPRPLVPFGGGIDSIVTVDAVARDHPDTALFVLHPMHDCFAAIAEPAAVTGLPVNRVGREIDPQVRRSAELGFLNGHVPVTAIVTAAALLEAVLDGRDAVILSNEWSASVPTLVSNGRAVNHQWSKSEEFEVAFAAVVRDALGSVPTVFSYLRPRTELWVAERFATLTRFHSTFRSCNRAFHQDPARRLDHWCGTCDKCCFIDLVLSPFMDAASLDAIFTGREPLENPQNSKRFATLLDLAPVGRPFECVGDIDECRAALLLASEREDRRSSTLLRTLRAQVDRGGVTGTANGTLLAPRESHHIPERYAPSDLLVRAR